MRAAFYGVVVAMALRGLTVPVHAEGALAVGLPNGDPANGFVYSIETNKPRGEARSAAMRSCKGVDVRDTSRARADCKIIETFNNECASIAHNGDRNTPSTAVGWGIGPDPETADNRAMTQCKTMRRGRGRACKLDGESVCDGNAR